MKIAIIGAGSWGTALAALLGSTHEQVCLWARKPQVAQAINESHRNPRYLENEALPASVHATADLGECVKGSDALLVVTPSSIMRSIANSIKPHLNPAVPILLCSKGVEQDSGCLPVQVFRQVLGEDARLAVLSGPNHAEEVIKGVPSGTVIASSSHSTACFFQDLLATKTFRTYTSDDVVGVELCAAFKNVIAIAVGVSYGLGNGDNTAAMIMTRGLAEMSRLVTSLGGRAITCMGLAGAGDLIATCTSEHSRNRSFGLALASGETLDAYCERTHMVVEGALACKTLKPLADSHTVELPITDLVRGIIWEQVEVNTASAELLSRPLKAEFLNLD